MSADNQKGKPAPSRPGPPRRSSPRYPLRRRVHLRCKGWPDFQKVFTENIGSKSLLVFVNGEPPSVGESVQLRIPGQDGAMANVLGSVVRVEPDAGGRAGVAIELIGGPGQMTAGLLQQRGDEEQARQVPNQGQARPRRPSRPPAPREGSQPFVVLGEDVDGGLDLTEESDGRGQQSPIELDLDDLQQTGGPPPPPPPPPPGVRPRGNPPPPPAPRRVPQPPPGPTIGSGLRRPPSGAGKMAKAPAMPDKPTPIPHGAHHQPLQQQQEAAIRQIGVRAGADVGRSRGAASQGEAPVVGIDFGTTYSKVAVVHEGEVVLIEDEASQASSRAAIPSAVAFLPDGSTLVGEPAREMLATEPAQVIASVKRVMGLSYSDPLANGLLGSLSCPSHAGPNDSIVFDVHGQSITVPEVCAKILGHLKNLASKWSGQEVKKAVFTVPVDFDIRSKRELEIAARMANIEIVGLVPEPVAAAMGCGNDGSGHSFVAVYDFGGGTFDASIVEVGQNRFTVRGAAGDRWLGGDDFDEVTARYVADEFQRSSGVSLHNRVEEWQRLIFASEEAKRWLSTLESVDVVLPDAARNAQGSQTLLIPMTRPLFVELADDVITSSLEVCRTAAIKAKVHPRKIDTLLITGGTTRIPAVRQAAERFFGKRGISGIHPEHAVVIGAAVRAAVLSKVKVPRDFVDRLRGLGRVGKNVGLALAGGMTEHIITAEQRPPSSAHRLYSTSRDGQTMIRLELVHGGSVRTSENHRIGGFVIEGLPSRPAGAISLDVYFELSSTGTLYVTAQERSTGLRAQGTFDLSL